jgi:hypothetical protein
VDAVIATTFALGVLEPWMSGVGGGGAMVLYRAREDRYEVIVYGMRAPDSWEGGPAGTVGTLGHIAPLSQNNSQSSECVAPNFGTVGTHPVGTKSGLGSTRPRLVIARCFVVGVDLMAKASPHPPLA